MVGCWLLAVMRCNNEFVDLESLLDSPWGLGPFEVSVKFEFFSDYFRGEQFQ